MFDDLQPDAFAQQRDRMVAEQLRARGIRDERVLSAMARVPRHEFVPHHLRSQAYEDHPLPIGEDQTISQPYIVALMLEYLAVEPGNRVLEVGTGSGYQTALLAAMGANVLSVERHSALVKTAAATLESLGYRNVTIVVGDGSRGWLAFAPYQRIIVSAAAPTIPVALLAQLSDGGRMILPVGSERAQELQLVKKLDGAATVMSLEGCRFVPLIADPAEQQRS